MTTFVGRARELDLLRGLLDDHRLVTITGPGGVGKTRLALESMRSGGEPTREFLVLALGELPPDAGIDEIAAHMGMDGPEAVALRLGPNLAVVVVDGCEHLHEAAADFVAALLAASDTLSVLATSREPLRISGEVLLPLEPLGLPTPFAADREHAPAVALFVDRARAAGAEWEATEENLDAIVELCRRIDALPLAIELAAARSRALTPVELTSLVTDRLGFLRSQARDAPARHRSIEATISVSVDQLDERSHQFFRHLSVFAEPFELELAHAVAADATDVFDTVELLADLVDRSLVVSEPRGGTTRYHLLDLVRDYARAELERHGESDAARERLTAAMVDEADRIIVEGVQRWSAPLLAEIAVAAPNLLSAVDWCIERDPTPDRAFRLFVALFGVVHQRRSEQVRATGTRLFARWPDEPAPWRGEALAVLATGMAIASDPQEVDAYADAALGAEGVTDIGAALAYRATALAAIGRHEWPRAGRAITAACAAAVAAPLPPFARELLSFQAIVADRSGDAISAADLVAQVLEESDLAHDSITELWGLVAAATIAAWGDRWSEVRALVARAAAVAAPLSDGWWDGTIFHSAAYLAVYDAAATSLLDGWAAGAPSWAAALERARGDGDVYAVAVTLRAASATAAQCQYAGIATKLTAALPATNELEVVPLPFPPPSSEAPPRPALPITAALREALHALRSTDSVDQPQLTDPGTERQSGALAREGEGWRIQFGTTTVLVRDLKGIRDLAVLVARPDEEVHCLELMGASDVGSESGPTVDAAARRAYQARILDLQAEIDDARVANDPARAEGAEIELDALVEQLAEAFGLGGRDRATGSSAERARSAVTYRIRAAIGRIGAVHPELARHLDNSVRTGAWCSYRPESPVAWVIHTD